MTTITASPAKLRDGTWGARVPGEVTPGAQIEIVTRAGKRWNAQVVRVLWTGQDRRTGDPVSLCATQSRDDDCDWCAECGERRGIVQRTDSSGMTGMVCRQCARQDRHALSFA